MAVDLSEFGFTAGRRRPCRIVSNVYPPDAYNKDNYGNDSLKPFAAAKEFRLDDRSFKTLDELVLSLTVEDDDSFDIEVRLSPWYEKEFFALMKEVRTRPEI